MASIWNFTIENQAVQAELVVTDNNFAPRALTLKVPSYTFGAGRVKCFDSGKFRKSFLFTEFGTIGGVAPTSLQDAYDKLVLLVIPAV